MIVSFNGQLRNPAGLGSKQVHGMMQQSAGADQHYGGWLRVNGGSVLPSMRNREFQLDIEDGPCLRVRVGEVDGGVAEFESIGDPLRPDPPAT